MSPKISVLLPVYNAQDFIEEAVSSILNQSFSNFELLIFNDASTDKTNDILESYSDPRIILHNSTQNRGYLYYLNQGLKIAKGEYIARMDADDISLPTRFEKQANYLDNHSEVGVVGSAIQIFGSEDRVKKYPKNLFDCQFELLFRSCFAHPAVMFRKVLLNKKGINYNEDFYTAEDYYLWVQLSSITSFYNLQETLLRYRINSGSISVRKKQEQFELKNRIQIDALRNILGIELSQKKENVYLSMLNPFQTLTINWGDYDEVLSKIVDSSIDKFPFVKRFVQELKGNIKFLAFYNTGSGMTILKGFDKLRKKYKLEFTKVELFKFYFKGMLGIKGNQK